MATYKGRSQAIHVGGSGAANARNDAHGWKLSVPGTQTIADGATAFLTFSTNVILDKTHYWSGGSPTQIKVPAGLSGLYGLGVQLRVNPFSSGDIDVVTKILSGDGELPALYPVPANIKTVPPESQRVLTGAQPVEDAGYHFLCADAIVKVQVTNRSGSTITITNGSWTGVLLVPGIGHCVALPSEKVLIAVIASGITYVPTDLSAHAWTKPVWSGEIGWPTITGMCGAGPPGGQAFGIWWRKAVVGETHVLSLAEDVGGWVYEFDGVNTTDIDSTWAKSLKGDGVPVSVDMTTTVGLSMLLGVIARAKVTYDGGWWAPSRWATVDADQELINASTHNDGGEYAPWTTAGYSVGTGALSVGSTADDLSGSGAYACGWGTGYGGLLVPIADPVSFGLVQSKFHLFSAISTDLVLDNPV